MTMNAPTAATNKTTMIHHDKLMNSNSASTSQTSLGDKLFHRSAPAETPSVV